MSTPKIYLPHLKQAVYWIKERESIRQKKEAGLPPPWTKNELMASTRWCNVRRMDDRVSIWLMDNFYQNLLKRPLARQAIMACSMARLFNLPETMATVYPKGFTRFEYDRVCRLLRERWDSNQKVFTGVYIVNGANAGGRKKWQLVMDNLNRMYHDMTEPEFDFTSMAATHKALMKYEGFGSFIAGQVVADLRHVLPHPTYWQDRHEWAPQGPGSTKGLNYVFNTTEDRLNQESFLERMMIYRDALHKYADIRAIHAERGLEAHDYQNTLCEVSKWARLLSGGRSKNKYSALDSPSVQGLSTSQPELF